MIRVRKRLEQYKQNWKGRPSIRLGCQGVRWIL